MPPPGTVLHVDDEIWRLKGESTSSGEHFGLVVDHISNVAVTVALCASGHPGDEIGYCVKLECDPFTARPTFVNLKCRRPLDGSKIVGKPKGEIPREDLTRVHYALRRLIEAGLLR